tara:strand:+ start:329 stop:526 length:198 start_codon:yes stop_codon:yes gene_type:complete
MPHSRSLNRFNRFSAKRRRRVLRAELPMFRESYEEIEKPFNNVEVLKLEALKKEVIADLIESGLD